MSSLVRFKIDDKQYKALIYERSSSRHECSCCRRLKYGVLVRLVEPVKKDTLICEECMVQIVTGQTIRVFGFPHVTFGLHDKMKYKKTLDKQRRAEVARAARRARMARKAGETTPIPPDGSPAAETTDNPVIDAVA